MSCACWRGARRKRRRRASSDSIPAPSGASGGSTKTAETARRPEDFLELVERARRGRLKLYVGFAAGVGKTYRMLQEAHDLRRRGVDVVVGFVEPHGRADTIALIEGLEVVPRKRIEYRGVQVEEMDLQAVVARKPQIAVVDEFAHTNAPGSQNRKRWQDVLALLDAGINIIGALNVQHLESLNGLIERATGVTVRETVPDGFLKQADQVVNLDLAVEDLQERLKQGKIYAADKIPWALENFFKDQNLATLRELALREVAESLDRAARPTEPQSRPAGRVMVCLASNPPRAKTLLERGSRMAGRLNTDWYVVYVETPRESPELIDSEAQRHLLANIEKARELGAEVVRLKSDDPAQAILDFARTHGVSRLILGRSLQPWWRQVLFGSVLTRLLREATDLDLHIVSFEEEQ
ncbi:MAG: histidine kinase [Deltaproteobacteria bacterium]|nr:MAG: histidine kinase [Deltaproteobacteria bacterium]